MPGSSPCFSLLAISLFLVMLISPEVGSFRLHAVLVPPYLAQGSGARFKCDFTGDLKHVYSIKWYKDNREFYRIQPRADGGPSKFQVFRTEGFSVDMLKSDTHYMVMTNVTTAAEGMYKCEMTGGPPLWASFFKAKHVRVVDLPDALPSISDYRAAYTVGETMSPVCVSVESRPSVHLQWFIDDKPSSLLSDTSVSQSLTAAPLNTTSTYSLLRYLITAENSYRGRVNIRCTASMHGTDYWESAEISVSAFKQKTQALGHTDSCSSVAPDCLITSFLVTALLWIFLIRGPL